MAAVAASKVKSIVSSHPVVLSSKTHCGYCKRVKQLLSEVGASYKVVELDVEDDGGEIQSGVRELTGQGRCLMRSSAENVLVAVTKLCKRISKVSL